MSMWPMVMPPAYRVMATSSREAGWAGGSAPAPPAASAGTGGQQGGQDETDGFHGVSGACPKPMCLIILVLLRRQEAGQVPA